TVVDEREGIDDHEAYDLVSPRVKWRLHLHLESPSACGSKPVLDRTRSTRIVDRNQLATYRSRRRSQPDPTWVERRTPCRESPTPSPPWPNPQKSLQTC